VAKVDKDCATTAQLVRATEGNINVRQSIADVLARANHALAIAEADLHADQVCSVYYRPCASC
jgi:hypothetical protein